MTTLIAAPTERIHEASRVAPWDDTRERIRLERRIRTLFPDMTLKQRHAMVRSIAAMRSY